jgi:hypothetical protein
MTTRDLLTYDGVIGPLQYSASHWGYFWNGAYISSYGKRNDASGKDFKTREEAVIARKNLINELFASGIRVRVANNIAEHDFLNRLLMAFG